MINWIYVKNLKIKKKTTKLLISLCYIIVYLYKITQQAYLNPPKKKP